MQRLIIFVSVVVSLTVAYLFTNSAKQTEVELTEFSKQLKAGQKAEDSVIKSSGNNHISLHSEGALGVKDEHDTLHQTSSQEQTSMVSKSENTLEESYDAFALSPEAETVQNPDDAEMVVSVSLTEAPEGDFDGYSSTIDVPISSASKVETDDMESKQP